MNGDVIQRRTPGERRAYTQGISTGAMLILDLIRQGFTAEQARAVFDDAHGALVRDLEADDGQ